MVYESRLNSHKAIEMLSHTNNGQDGIVEAGLVPTLVGKLLEENDEIKVGWEKNWEAAHDTDKQQAESSREDYYANYACIVQMRARVSIFIKNWSALANS